MSFSEACANARPTWPRPKPRRFESGESRKDFNREKPQTREIFCRKRTHRAQNRVAQCFLHIVRCGVFDLVVVLDLDDENPVALFEKIVGTEFPAFWMLAFLPSVFDWVETYRRVLKPCIEFRSIVTRAKFAGELSFWRRVCNHQIRRRLEIGGVANRLAPALKVAIFVFDLPKELLLLVIQCVRRKFISVNPRSSAV